MVCDSIHGEELIDINGQVATDIFLAAQQKFVMILTQTLQQAEINGEIQLQNLELDAGQAASTTKDYRLILRKLIEMFEKAVVPK
ncbi:MAG: hypothetical protein QNJ53_10590 [Pleurocapsa sp. MO_192.B19]|nr:hypothetical protein [Pleurocapsa sp. MO_192.B19]